MSGPGPTATPFVGSDRRSEITDRLAARARETPPTTTPQAIASRVAASIQNQMKDQPRPDEEKENANPKWSSDRKDYTKDDMDTKRLQDQKEGFDKDYKDMRDSKDPTENKDEKDQFDSNEKNTRDDLENDKAEKDDQDTKALKDQKDLGKETFKEELEKSPKEASEKEGDKEQGDKDTSDKDKEQGDKDTSDKVDDKEGDKDTSDKDGDTEIGTEETDEFVDPANRGQPAETSASRLPAGGTGRPTSLLTRLPVI